MSKESKKPIVKYEKKRLENNMAMGMAGVDPADIRPPTVLLIQASSKKEEFIDENGKHPAVGEYFHNGTLKILKEFLCYFIWAAKGQISNKRFPEKGPQDMYRAIGVMADDFSVFGMMFKSSSLYSLSGLFTTVSAQKRGMYSIKCKVSTKFISGEKGEWYIPVVSVVQLEDDSKKLNVLEKIAQQYNSLGVQATSDDEKKEITAKDLEDPALEELLNADEDQENVEPDEIPS